MLSKLTFPPFVAANVVCHPELVIFANTEFLLSLGVKVIESNSPFAFADRFRFDVLMLLLMLLLLFVMGLLVCRLGWV